MQKNRATFLSWSLLGCLVLHSFVPVIQGQEPQRERRVSPAAPTVTPAPSPTPVATTSPAGVAELQSRISQILARPELAPAFVGVKVVSVNSGNVLFEQNANKLLRPASNMKIYTVAAALDRLTPDYRFKTSVYVADRPAADGTINGDLIIYGNGDPSLSFRFNNGDYNKAINDLADRIVATGVKRITGDLIGDESFFSGAPYGSGWEWEDLQWWYGAEVSALSVNDNFVNLSIKPGAAVGAPAIINITPADPLLTIKNRLNTAPRGKRRDLSVYRELATNVLEISGSIALGDPGYSGRVAISQPALLFVYMLRAALSSRGITINGKTRSVDNRSGASIISKPGSAVRPPIELTSLQSPPLSVIAAQTLKPSQNLYTELILRTLGKTTPPAVNLPVVTGADDSTEAEAPAMVRTSELDGVEIVRAFLRQAGMDATSLILSDASGLSRNDLVTADATVQLLIYMRRHRFAQAFRDALPIAGVDGTLRNRMKGTAAQNNLRAKTGTLSSVASLSGYVTTASGEELAFSIIVNNYPDASVNPVTLCIDPIAVLLASFNGHS